MCPCLLEPEELVCSDPRLLRADVWHLDHGRGVLPSAAVRTVHECALTFAQSDW